MRFLATSEYFDAALNSLNAFTILIKKESYRIKISNLNNPASSELGFSLESEILNALKPLYLKAKNTNTNKFSKIVSSLLNYNISPSKNFNKSLDQTTTVFSTVMSLVGNLVLNEKKITQEDLDFFLKSTSKYFAQYEKLNAANMNFNQNISRINYKLKDLQYDVQEMLIDITSILYGDLDRNTLGKMYPEEIYLKYLDNQKIVNLFSLNKANLNVVYPSYAIKSAKEISNNLQKLFKEYNQAYVENYQQIRTILIETKSLGKNVNIKQINTALIDLEQLYNESKKADVFGVRITTLNERLQRLYRSEQNQIDNL